MSERSWNDHYASGNLPWDTGAPDPVLTAFVAAGRVAPTRTLEVGAGTGSNAIWLAEQGFDVLGVDVSPLAVEAARGKLAGRPLPCRFETRDFLTEPIDEPPFGFVFDRGCFHVFDEPAQQASFAARVAALLAPGGTWLSLLGSTEGPPREFGPPRRSARDIATAIEPALEIVELSTAEFADGPAPWKAWICLARRRLIPAQPSGRATSSHLEFVRAYLAAIEQGRVVGHESDWYTDDAVQVEFPNKLQPKGATRSLDDLKRAGDAGARIVDRQSYEIVRSAEQGDTIAVEAVFRATFKIDVLGLPAGQTMTARFAMFFEMRGGKIARHHTYDCFEPW